MLSGHSHSVSGARQLLFVLANLTFSFLDENFLDQEGKLFLRETLTFIFHMSYRSSLSLRAMVAEAATLLIERRMFFLSIAIYMNLCSCKDKVLFDYTQERGGEICVKAVKMLI